MAFQLRRALRQCRKVVGAMSQPKWEYVANLGDTSPLEYGGLFLYRDTTGVYGYTDGEL